ncbi:MAG: AAA family ATPase [Rhodocyclaceae bacterium]|nr:ATP-dependent zinc metalloprotease FtsH [Bacteroidia bacterium]MCQ3924604.1 AAA family ATPase [Rhodocyclaceae bacterium]
MRLTISREGAMSEAAGQVEDRVSHPSEDGDDDEIHLWILRILVPCYLYKEFVVKNGRFRNDELAEWLGLGDLLVEDEKRFSYRAVINRLKETWKEAEAKASAQPPDSSNMRKVQRLGRQLGLNKTETDILRFRLASERDRKLRGMVSSVIGAVPFVKTVEILASCLKRPETEIHDCLSPDGALAASGIIEPRTLEVLPLNAALPLLGCIVEEIGITHSDPFLYFRSRIARSALPRLAEANYAHLSQDISLLKSYLGDALVQGRAGANVLIHGVPGSGKTEFVRMLATVLGATLYEIVTERRDGSLLSSGDRLRAYRLSQRLLSRSNQHMILFDEVEDIFPENEISKLTGANASARKGAIVRILENNPVPAFWVANNIRVIDAAFLRRFDYVLELNAPPRSVRGRILDHYLDGLAVSADWKRRMAEHEMLMPAIVERAAKVVRASAVSGAPQEVERGLSRIVGNTLEAMGLPREPRHCAPVVEGYRLDALNTDCDIVEVQFGLAQHRKGRLCLYGPPGTGKTAFGRHLADTLDRPLLVRRASDIVSPWVGVTEKNLACLFREAQEEEAVLLLDEADSFLRDRQGAQRSWEVTEVNEMLAQMECFEGLFIASTNLMGSLDAAALRRFDMKIRFDYLKPEQARTLFLDLAHRLGLDVPKAIETRLVGLICLTPGDFANVARQGKLRRIASAHELLERLAAECAIKPEGKKRPMGFAVV